MQAAQKLLAAFGNCFMPVEQPDQVQARQELAGQPADKQKPSNARKKKK